MVSPYFSPTGESKLQGELMGVRVKEDGRSEGCAEMAQIGVELLDNITLRESGQTSIWSLVARRSEKPT